MKPDMGEIQRMSPSCVKGEDTAPGGHPEAENVPPPGTPALSNGEEAAAVAARLGMSPLKLSVANEGRRASPLYKGAAPPSPAARALPPSPSARALPSNPAACALRKPVLILRRLDPKKMRRKSDIEEMGLNNACARRIRRELARGKRNCRRRYLRKMGRISLKKAPRMTTAQAPQRTRPRRRRVAVEDAAGRPPLEGPAAAAAAAAGASFASPPKKRSQEMPNHTSSPLSVLPQPQGWASQHFQPHPNPSPKYLTNGTASHSPQSSLEPHPTSPNLQGTSRQLFPASESLHAVRNESLKSQQHQKRYEPAASSSSATWFSPTVIPPQTFPPGGPQVNGTQDATHQTRMHSPLAVTSPPVTAQPSRDHIGVRRPPPLIPLPRVEASGISHSRNKPQDTQASRCLPYSLELRDTSLQGHLDPRAASQPPGGQRTVFAVRMKTDPAHNPMLHIPVLPASHPDQKPHQAAAQTPAHQAPPPSRVMARTSAVPSNTVWIVDSQKSSELPFASVSPSRPALQHYTSALPSSTVPSPHHTSPSSRQEVPQDLSISSPSVITSAVRPRVINTTNTSLPMSSSHLSLILTAGVPLVPVSSEANASAPNTVTTITRAPVVSTVPVQVSKQQEDNVVSYETKKSKAVKSRKLQESDEVVQAKRIKLQEGVEGGLMLSEDSHSIQSDSISSTTASTTLTSESSPSVVNKVNYVAVISVTPSTTTTVTTTVSSTTTTTTTTSTTFATRTITSAAITDPLFATSKIKSHRKDLPNDSVALSGKASSLAQKTDAQESNAKTPFILVPKKRLRVMTEAELCSVKGTPTSVVKQLREEGIPPRSSIIHTTATAQDVHRESGKSLEEVQSKKTPSPAVVLFSSASSPARKTLKRESLSSPAKTVATLPSSAYRASPATKKRLRKVVVRVEKLTEKSFSDAFLAAHNVSPACGARLCRHLKVLQGAGQYHRPLNRRRRVRKALLALTAAPARPTAPSPEIPRPPPIKPVRLVKPPKLARLVDYTPSPSTSSSPASRSQSPVVPPPPIVPVKKPVPAKPPVPARLSEAAGILHINMVKRRRLLVLRNKRLQPSNLKLLFELGLDIAKKASKNSTLDRMGVRGPILDPGYFGIKGAPRPSQNHRKPGHASQVSQGEPSQANQTQPGQAGQVSAAAAAAAPPQKVRNFKKAAAPGAAGRTQPRIYFPDGHVLILQQQQQQQQLHYQQQQQQQQYLYPGQVPATRMSCGAGVSAAIMGALGSPSSHPSSHTVLLQAASHPHRAKLVMVDQQGHMREALVNSVPHGYSHYPAPGLPTTPATAPAAVSPVPAPGPVPGPSSHPEGWSGRPQVSRDPLAPPLMFMGSPGMGAVPREHTQPPQAQPATARPPASRAMPPPLSFMGQSGETASWAGSQHSQQPAGMSWPRLVGHPSRAYPVINHTKHVIANKAPPNYFGPPPQYTPKSSYNMQRLVFQGQSHPTTPTTATSRPSPGSRHHPLEWHATTAPQATPHPQEQHHRVTTGTIYYPPHPDAARVSSEQRSRPRQAAVVQGDTATGSRQQASDPGVTASSSAGPGTASSISASATTTTTTATTATTTPSTSTASIEKHQCHQTWLPEVMAVVEALLLQLVDAGLPTRESFITHTLKQLLYARCTTRPTPAFCCTAQEKRWYVEFYNTHCRRLQAMEEARQPICGLSQDEVRLWLSRLKVDMVKFHGVPPQRIYYLHELNFFLDQQTREVKYHRMFPGLPVMSPGSKDTVSVLFTLGADGQVGPGMIIFPRMVIPERLFESLRRVAGGGEWVLGSSANGWLTRDCVLEFVSDVFVPWLRRRAVHFPAALFSSEYISGVSVVPVADRFVAQGVQLISVPREIAGVLSPAEWTMGYHLRWHWGRVVKEWSDSHDNKPLLEENFAPFIISFLSGRAVPRKVMEKFAKFGICPFDAQAMFYFLLKYHSLGIKGIKGEKSRLQNGI